MKKNILALTFMFVVICGYESSQAGLLFTYNQLALKDLDEVNDLITQKTKESRKSSSGQSVPLKEALQAVISRPNEDGLLSKVLPTLRNELDRLDMYEKVMLELVNEAIFALKNPKNFSRQAQVTYALFLNNLILEVKNSALDDGPEKTWIEKIAKSKVVVSKDALKEIKSKLMKEVPSPANTAQNAIDENQKLNEQKAKKTEK
jgi:hypothetical protein